MPKAQETVLEIDLKALKHNFNHLKSKLKPNTKFLAVVKAFAYGSDASKIANHLQDLNADYFAVAYKRRCYPATSRNNKTYFSFTPTSWLSRR